MKRYAILAALALAAPLHAQSSPTVDAVLALDSRKADAARDQYRHPSETIAFFRIEPGMTVIDYAPSGGWWTRILVPYLGEKGQYIGMNPDVSQKPDMAGMADLGATFPAKAATWTGVPAARIQAYNTGGTPAALNGTVDRILIMRMFHNMMAWNIAPAELKAMHALLKPGGMIGIEDHRARASAPDEEVTGSKGYIRQADVVRIMGDAGFELVGESPINNNPKDTADWPNGVWTLPPSFALKDVDRAKYAAIGESDRFTLLFRKKG